MSWTDDRIDTLRTMWEKGMTASQIAEALSEPVSAIVDAVIAELRPLLTRGAPLNRGPLLM